MCTKPLILFFLGFFVYMFSFGNQFVWDDEQFIVKNALVQHLALWPEYFTTNTVAGAGFVSNYYRPLTTLSFALDYAVWGLNPLGFHLTNTLLHALAGVLVYLVLRRLFNLLTRAPFPTESLAFVTSIAFLLHPAQVEAVAYMNSRGDSLGLVLGLLAVLASLAMSKTKTDNHNILLSIAATALFVAAVLAKEVSIVWILPLLWIGWIEQRKSRISGPLAVGLIGAIVAALYMLLRFTVLNFQDIGQLWGPNAPYVRSPLVRVATFTLHTLPTYAKILLWPSPLFMERTVPIINTLADISFPLLGGFFALLAFFAAACILLWKTSKPHFRVFLFGAAWFVFFLAPYSGIFLINGLLYEHWLYVPMIGWWLAIFALLHTFFTRLGKRAQNVLISTLPVVFLIWGILSIKHILVWRTPIGFYEYTLRFAQTARLYNNLGMAYAEAGRNDEAIDQYTKSLGLSDTYPQTHHNLGNVYASQGNTAKAKREYEAALALNPYFVFSINNLIALALKENNTAEARRWLEYGLQQFPQNVQYTNALRQLESSSIQTLPQH